jgi:hypothetical protein
LQLFFLRASHFLPDVKNVWRPLFDHKIIYSDSDLFVCLHCALVLVARLSNFFLRISPLDCFHHSTHLIELGEIIEGAVFHVERLLFDEITSAQRIDSLSDSGFKRNNLLRAECDSGRFFSGKRERLVVGVGVQGLGSAEDCRKCLQRDARDIILRLLRRQRDACRLRMKAHQATAFVFRAETFLHQPVPDFSRCPVFGDLFEEIVVCVEEKAKPWAELVDVEAASARPLHVFDAVVDREGELLQRGGSRFSYVVTRDRDRIETRSNF